MSVLVSGSASVGGAWASVRFCRSRFVSGVWVLSGVPAAGFGPVLARLFAAGAAFVAAGSSLASRLVWVAFRSPRALSARLASVFPVPAGVPALVVRSGVVLSGAAERSVLAALPAPAARVAVAALPLRVAPGVCVRSVAASASVLLSRVRPVSPVRPGAAVLASLLRSSALSGWLRWSFLAVGRPVGLPPAA